jgi:hypothetical protein
MKGFATASWMTAAAPRERSAWSVRLFNFL